MKITIAFVALAFCLASIDAFAPPLATRAVGKAPPKRAATKKVEPKKVVKKAGTKVVKKAAPKKVVKKVAPKKVVKKVAPRKAVKKVAPKKVVRASKAATSGGYPSFKSSTENWKPFAGISGGGNKAPVNSIMPPDFSNPALQIKRDPKVYAAAAATRKASLYGTEFVYEDGLTDLERKQRSTIPTFLTGSAKSQADVSTIRDDIVTDPLIFGLDQDRFQLLFISIFGLFTLVGCLSGTIEL